VSGSGEFYVSVVTPLMATAIASATAMK